MGKIIFWLTMFALLTYGSVQSYNRYTTPFTYEGLPSESDFKVLSKTSGGKELEGFVIYSPKLNAKKAKEISDKYESGGISERESKIYINLGSSSILSYGDKEIVITAKKDFLIKLAYGSAAYQHNVDDKAYYSHITPSDGKIIVLVDNKEKTYSIDELSEQ